MQIKTLFLLSLISLAAGSFAAEITFVLQAPVIKGEKAPNVEMVVKWLGIYSKNTSFTLKTDGNNSNDIKTLEHENAKNAYVDIQGTFPGIGSKPWKCEIKNAMVTVPGQYAVVLEKGSYLSDDCKLKVINMTTSKVIASTSK